MGPLVSWIAAPTAEPSALNEGIGSAPTLAHVLERPGRALRAALGAMSDGERVLAEALLAACAERHPIVADYADLLRMRLRVESGDYADAVAMRERWPHGGSPVSAEFYTLLGRAYAGLGEEEPARRAWKIAAHETPRRERAVDLHISIAESYLRSGDAEGAARAYLTVWTRYPETDGSGLAEAGLEQIEQQRGRSMRSASDHRRRADALYRGSRNEEALAAYDQALALGLVGRERTQARNDRAETLFRLRRYTEAAVAFEALPSSDDRAIQRARAHARAGDVERGARELEQIGRRSRGSQAPRALLLAALLWDGEDETARARSLYGAVLKRSPGSGYAAAARWRLGWSAYRSGHYAEALRHFDELDRREKDPVAALRPRYWSIRAAEQLGAPDAGERYATLAREFPLSYYGWRARQRTDLGEDERAPVEIQPGRAALRPAELERPSILLEAGLEEAARVELDRVRRHARGMADRLALAQLYADAGDFHRPQRLVVDAYTELLARGPALDHLELWWHAWPAPFEEEMRGATLEGLKIAPELVYSIMREESGYRPEVVSVSGARGLLQLMPSTAERVARDAKLGEFSVDDLFLPRVNIQLGTDYLSSLLRQFDGNTAAAIGSYNAGPHAVARWLAHGPTEEDVWVEEIPYDQTRAYVKRVLRSLQAYRVLY